MRVASTRGTTVFVPGLLELKMYGKIMIPAPHPLRVALALRTTIPRSCFHTVWGGIDPGNTVSVTPGLLKL